MSKFELLHHTFNGDMSIAVGTVNGEAVALLISGREMRQYDGKFELLIEHKLSRLRLILGVKESVVAGAGIAPASGDYEPPKELLL